MELEFGVFVILKKFETWNQIRAKGQHCTDKIRKKMLGKANNFHHPYHTLRSLEQIFLNFKRVFNGVKKIKKLNDNTI